MFGVLRVGSWENKRHLPPKTGKRRKGSCPRLHGVDFERDQRSIMEDAARTRPGKVIEFGNTHAPSIPFADMQGRAASNRLALGFGQLIGGFHVCRSSLSLIGFPQPNSTDPRAEDYRVKSVFPGDFPSKYMNSR